MAISHGVSFSNTNKTTGTTIALTTNSAYSTGDLIVVSLASDDATGTYSCADSAGNTYALDISVVNTGVARMTVFSAVATTTSTLTITCTHPSLTARAMVVDNFTPDAGSSFTSARKVGSTSAVGSASPYSSGTLTVTSTSDIMYGSTAIECPASDVVSPPANFVFTYVGTTGAGATSNMSVAAGYDLTAATEAYAPTDSTANRNFASSIIEYGEVASGATTDGFAYAQGGGYYPFGNN